MSASILVMDQFINHTSTMMMSLELGSWILKANEMRRIATGLKAFGSADDGDALETIHLEHLDERDREGEVGVV